jgi:hypothetical protein
MTRADPDCLVTTLVEIHGGPAGWEKVEERLRVLGWGYRESTPKERRTARRAFGTDPSEVIFRWVEIPVVGSTWRAGRNASWQVAEVHRATNVVVHERMLGRADVDRPMQPEWQVYSTRSLVRATAPVHVDAWSKPVWWLRRTLYRTAVHMGWFDVGTRVHGDRAAVLHLAQGLGEATNVDVRPLDGRGRPNALRFGEDELNRGLVFFLSPLIVAALLLVLARSAGSLGIALCWFAALACMCIAWWTALTLPLARTRRRSLALALVATAVIMVWALGIPGVRTGMTPPQALVMASVTYYAVGLVLLGRRWTWQVLAASVLPLVATLIVAALPLTARFLHDAYADALSLTPEETSVSTVWQLVAAVKLLWPTFGAVLFIAAGWGILRYFHFIRPRSFTAGTVTAVALVTTLTTTVSLTLDSPSTAADRTKQAAARGTEPPSYFGVSPEWVCVVPTVPAHRLTEQGGTLRVGKPYISFGAADGQVVLWNQVTAGPLRIAADQVRITPRRARAGGC